MSEPKSARERLAELRAKPLSRVRPPAAPVVPGPWPKPKLTEKEIIEKQRVIDEWWEWNLAEKARRAARAEDPGKRLEDWIWGRDQ
jgi:hypothetical protein